MYFYVEKDGALQRMHPNTKTFALLGIFLAALLVQHPLWACIPLVVSLLALFAGGGGKNALRIAPIAATLFVASLYIWTFMYVDPRASYTWLKLGGFYFPRETVLWGVGMGVRITAMLLAGLAFLTVTRVEDFTAGLHRMGLPFGMCFGLSLSFRLLPLFVGTAVTISEAQRSRGLDLESGGPITKARKYAPLLIPVFVSSMRNADELALALESKGFGRANPRTYLRELPFGVADIAAIILVCCLVGGLWYLTIKGYGAI